ncbi:MAG TPA: TetR family transcriptional regulator [Acidimicrobiales bacterium]|nr:TetR family transcriptional regulator [Acidimicrobiales bacterium]
MRGLTRSQEARRQRVIDAAVALALEGGYDAVQMRDVAGRAHVAMGTVYRYFSSKDHLLAAALVHWVEQLDARLAQVPPRGGKASERVLDVLDRALRAMARQPRLVAAVFCALASPDRAAVECQQQMGSLMDRIIIRAMGRPEPPDHLDRTRVIGHVWYSSMVGWVNGWSDMSRVRDELATAVRLLLPEELALRMATAAPGVSREPAVVAQPVPGSR